MHQAVDLGSGLRRLDEANQQEKQKEGDDDGQLAAPRAHKTSRQRRVHYIERRCECGKCSTASFNTIRLSFNRISSHRSSSMTVNAEYNGQCSGKGSNMILSFSTAKISGFRGKECAMNMGDHASLLTETISINRPYDWLVGKTRVLVNQSAALGCRLQARSIAALCRQGLVTNFEVMAIRCTQYLYGVLRTTCILVPLDGPLDRTVWKLPFSGVR